MRGGAQLERTRTTGTRPYLLRGLMRCGICSRKMQGATIRHHDTYYRCMARTLAPGSPTLTNHPRTVNLREADVLEPLNGWINRLFDRHNVDQTVTALVDSQDGPVGAQSSRETIKKRLTEAEARLRRFQTAIEAGVDPVALVEAINAAQAQRAAAQAELEGAAPPNTLTKAEVYAMIDSLGDVVAALSDAHPGSLSKLYRELGLELRYESHERAVIVTASPRVVNECVRGGT